MRRRTPRTRASGASKRHRREVSWPRLAWLLGAACFLLLALTLWQAESVRDLVSPDSRPSNVVLITVDTLRADRLGCYGNRQIATPNMDRLAESGVVFENATTVAPLTLPAHCSFFTGTYPISHGVRDNGGYYLEPDQVTLAEILKAAGYATGAFVGAFVLDSRWGLEQGFDRYFDDFDFSEFEEVSLDRVQRRGDGVVAEAIRWMESVEDRPFFCWMHLYDPHAPYEPPDPYRDPYRNLPWGGYDGEVAYVDHLVGQVLAWLERRDLDPKTAVAIVGDHGEGLGEHAELDHGFFVYDSTVRIPFILKAPHPELEGRRVAAQVRGIDLMPTLLEIVGVSIPPSVQGQSLLDFASGKREDPGLVAYSESYYPRRHYGWSELRSLRDGFFHFIAAPRPELYDVRSDPLETHNLATERPEVTARMVDQLGTLLAQHRGARLDDVKGVSLDLETEQRLAALGYLGSARPPAPRGSQVLADPKDKVALHRLLKTAEYDSTEGRLNQAFEKIQQVLAQDPEVSEAHSLLGRLFLRARAPDRAAEAFEAVLMREPEDKSAMFNLALARLEVGDAAAAERHLRRLIELDRRNNKAYFLLARLLIARREFSPALALLHQAIQRTADVGPFYTLIAECQIELGDLQKAKAAIESALRIKEDLPRAHYHLAVIRERQEDVQGAIDAYEREIQIFPHDYRTFYRVAMLYGQLGQIDKQIDRLESAIKLNGAFAAGYLYLARAHLDSGTPEKALELAARGMELDPEPSLALIGEHVLAEARKRTRAREPALRPPL